MRGPSLSKVSIRGFTPRTYGSDDVEKKRVVRDKLLSQIDDIEALRNACRGKQISLDSCFYLFGNPPGQGRAAKDLDNLLKIVFDALPDYMDRRKTERGLGIIEEDNDHLIFEIRAEKRLVSDETAEGIDFEIFEWHSESGQD